MEGRLRTLASGLFLIVWLASSAAAWAEERERWQFKAGVTYEAGDFGTGITTKTLFLPFTIRYLGDRFDLGLTVPFIQQETSQAVTLVDGVPVRIRAEEGVKQTASGLGDLVLKGRLYLLDDPGPASFLPAVTPFFKLKFPTADEDDGLGTGEFDYGFGLEFDKRLNGLFLFADAGYTFIGDPPGINLRDRVSAGGGVGYYLTRNLSASVSLAWSRSLVKGADDPTDVFFDLSWRITRTLTLSPHVSVGLTNGSPDFGLGFETSYRFGRR